MKPQRQSARSGLIDSEEMEVEKKERGEKTGEGLASGGNVIEE